MTNFGILKRCNILNSGSFCAKLLIDITGFLIHVHKENVTVYLLYKKNPTLVGVVKRLTAMLLDSFVRV